MTFINANILKNKEHVQNCQTSHRNEVTAMNHLHRQLLQKQKKTELPIAIHSLQNLQLTRSHDRIP